MSSLASARVRAPTRRSSLAVVVTLLLMLIWLSAPAQGSPATAQGAATASPWISFTRLQGLASDSILALHATADGYLWAATSAGLSILAPSGAWLTLTSGDGLAGDIVTDLADDPASAGRRWVATADGATLLDDGGRPQEPGAHTLISYGAGDALVDTSISAVAVDLAGRVWLGTARLDDQGNESGSGISVLSPGARPFAKADDIWSAYTQAAGTLSSDVVHDIAVDARGSVWVAGLGGIDAYSGDQRTAYSTAHGLPSNNVRAILPDGDLLWAATDQGLAVLSGGATPHDRSDDTWAVFTTGNSKLSANSAKSLARDASGRIWVGTAWLDRSSRGDAGAGVSVLDPAGTPLSRADDTWAVFRASDGLASDAVRAVVISAGVPFFGTRAGVSRLELGAAIADRADDQWTTYSASRRLAGFTVSALAPAGATALWLGTDAGLSLLDYHGTPEQRGDDTWVTLTTAHQLPANSIRALAADRRGWLWVGTGAGLQVRDLKGTPSNPKDDAYITYTAPKLASEQINDIAIDSAGRAWIACGSYFDGALHVLDPGASLSSTGDDRLASFAEADGLPASYVRAVALEGQAAAWVATDGGAARLAYGASPFSPGDDSWTTFTAANSAIGQDLVRDVAYDSDGNVWFALASEGVSARSPDGVWTRFTQSDGLVSNATRAILQSAEGRNDLRLRPRLWIGTSGGVSLLSAGASLADKGDDQWASFGADALTYDSVNSLLVDPHGQVWAATSGSASVYGQFLRHYLPAVQR